MTKPHTFSPVILREYDVRGIVGKTLNIPDAGALGRAYGTFVSRAGGKRVVVGYDGRTHSPDLEKALVEGLVSTGLQVERIGMGPTPMLYFSLYHLDADAAIMVTGSHNPPDQNGFKMLMAKRLPGGGPIYGDAIKKLGEMAAKGDFIEGNGSEKTVEVRDAFVERLLKDYSGTKPLKIVWDIGNGAAGEIVQRLVKELPGEHILLFPEVDGRFPNHHPDPTIPANLVDLQKAVAEHKADFGIAFDGDADRIGAVDEKGRILAGDQLLALFAGEVLKEHPGAVIISEVKASQVLYDYIALQGGKPLMWKTGHSLIKQKMYETKSPLGGEMSGHVFFADKYYGYDDAIYSAVRLISFVSASGKSLGQWRDILPQVIVTPEIRFDVDEARKFPIVEEIKARLKKEGADFNDIDGVRVKTAEGWWLIRASNTGAVLVARAEAKDEAGLERLKDLLASHLAASGVKLPEE